MRPWRRLFVVATALGLALGAAAACGLDVTGTLASGEAGAPDGPTPGQPPPPPEGIDASQACDGSACGMVVPAGWAVVTFGARAAPCAAGFASNDVVESPVADAGACACGCAVTAQPSCMTGSSAPKVDVSGTAMCNITSPVSFPANNGACSPQMFPVRPTHLLVNAPPPSGGACDAGSSPRRDAVGATEERVCVPPTCASGCNQPGVKTCLLASGDQACPAGTTDKHVIGTDYALTCGACACQVTGTCEGTTTLFSDTMCNTEFAQVDSGICTAIPNTDTASYKWLGNPHNVSCSVGAVSTDASVALVGATTICCP